MRAERNHPLSRHKGERVGIKIKVSILRLPGALGLFKGPDC